MVTGTSEPVAADSTPHPGAGPFARWPHSFDVALAVVVFVLEVIGILGGEVNESGEFSLSMLGDVPAATYLFLAASSIALLWRRTWPLTVLAATLSASLAWDVIGLVDAPSLAILVSLYGVGRYIDVDRDSFLAIAVALIVVAADDLLIEGEQLAVVGLSLALTLAAWYLGRRIKGRREYLALIEERADYLERERAAEAQRAVDAERNRIARELHDLVAHRVSMITVQAGAAQTVAVSDPARAIRAMEAVEEAGREALEELRQVLGVLRGDQGRDLVPVHGLADIPELISDMRSAGMDVRLDTRESPKALPAQVDFASYRIVQEALTNVLKHGGPDAKAEVRLNRTRDTLNIEVTNSGSGVSALPRSGHGLVGMRERANLLGGTFDAGPRPDGSFQILARLPIEQSSP